MKEVDIEGAKITVQEHDHVNMVNHSQKSTGHSEKKEAVLHHSKTRLDLEC